MKIKDNMTFRFLKIVSAENEGLRSKVKFLMNFVLLALAYDLLTLGQVKSRGWVKCDRASSRLFIFDSQAIFPNRHDFSSTR